MPKLPNINFVFCSIICHSFLAFTDPSIPGTVTANCKLLNAESWIQRGSTRRHPNSQSLEQGPDKNRRRRMKSKQHSLDQDDPQDVQVLNPENVQKALADFREKGGRYSYTESHHYHFEIKHW